MVILAMDSSGAACSCAVMRDGVILAQSLIQNGNTHSQQLMVLVERVLADAGLTLSQVDRIACVTGPGSFTGVRIGVCAARALAMGQEKPVVSVTALEALSTAAFNGLVCALIDARHDQAYCAAYQDGEEVLPAQARYVEAFLDELALRRENCLFVGDGAHVYAQKICDVLGDRAYIASGHGAQLYAAQAAQYAFLHPEISDAHDMLLPVYLRASQAEQEYARKEQKNG